MADVTVKRIDEMDSLFGGVFVRARASLGVTSFGMNVENLPPHHDQYPNHDHVVDVTDGQEEVYIPLKGSATLIAGEQEWKLEPGLMARVGAAEKRKIVPGPDGVQLLALGGVPGRAYEAPPWSEVGAPAPGPNQG